MSAPKPIDDLGEWVAYMDRENGWPAFEAQVREFADKYELPFSKALLHILFDVGGPHAAA